MKSASLSVLRLLEGLFCWKVIYRTFDWWFLVISASFIPVRFSSTLLAIQNRRILLSIGACSFWAIQKNTATNSHSQKTLKTPDWRCGKWTLSISRLPFHKSCQKTYDAPTNKSFLLYSCKPSWMRENLGFLCWSLPQISRFLIYC